MNKLIIFLVVIGVTFTINAYAQTTIQKSFYKKVDFNLDGKFEDVHLIIYGENFKKLFKWELTVQKDGQTIFNHICDDSWLDDFFNDPHYYLDKGESYHTQKTQYYFNDLPNGIVGITKITEESWNKDDSWLKIFVEKNLKEQLSHKYNIEGEEALSIIKAAIIRLTTGVDTLSISCNPLTGRDKFIFIPEINAFLRYYAP